MITRSSSSHASRNACVRYLLGRLSTRVTWSKGWKLGSSEVRPEALRGPERYFFSRLVTIFGLWRRERRHQPSPLPQLRSLPPSLPSGHIATAMATGLPGLRCCGLAGHGTHGSLPPLGHAHGLLRRPPPRASALRYSSLQARPGR